VLMSLIVKRARGIATSVVLAASVFALSLALLAAPPAAQASSNCPNELLRTGPGANLPDCRAYEVVSPPQKNGGEVDGGLEVETIPAPQQAAPNGEAITYGAQTPFPEAGPLAAPPTLQYLSRRTPAGWTTQAITPAQGFPGGMFDLYPGSEEFNLFQGFSEDLSYAFLDAYEPSPVPGAPEHYFNPYLRDDEDNSYQLLSGVTPPVEPAGPADAEKPGFITEYAGMSTDGSHVAFVADDALTPGALPGNLESGPNHIRNLYEWSDGKLELVSVLPTDEGGEAVQAEFGNINSRFRGGGENLTGLNEGFENVLSKNGTRAFWTAIETGRLYMRELTPTGAKTVLISGSQRAGSKYEGEPAIYWDASTDGSEVYFTSCEALTNDSTASCQIRTQNQEEPFGEDLYQYDANTGTLTDLTVAPTPGQTASVEAVLGVSEDGSDVYFVARGALVEGAPSGAFNIYVWHDGTIRLIASPGGEDYFLNEGAPGTGRAIGLSTNLTRHGLTRVSPSGRYLAFESTEPLTGYDTTPARAGACDTIAALEEGANIGVVANKTGKCVEVFEYDAVTGKLNCASCNPTGLPPVGDSIVPPARHVLFQLRGWQSRTVQQHYLLDDGRLFFDSTDELLPQASNSGKLNVYEYEPDEAGDCQGEAGCLALISSGTSSSDSFFVDASASGNDVFFLTRQSLVPEDGDEALDVYDARVDGGFATASSPPCSGEACRLSVTPAPAIYQAPPSATFAGPGNPAPPAVAPTTTSHKAKKKSKPRKKQKQKHKAKPKARHSRAHSLSGRGSR
jgi:hypothetical protein